MEEKRNRPVFTGIENEELDPALKWYRLNWYLHKVILNIATLLEKVRRDENEEINRIVNGISKKWETASDKWWY